MNIEKKYRRLLLVKRVLWWIGLVLLTPAFSCLFSDDENSRNGTIDSFRYFPYYVEPFSSGDPYGTLDVERLLFCTFAGLVCWAIFIILKISMYIKYGSKKPVESSIHRIKNIMIVSVMIIYILASLFVGFMLVLMIGLAETSMTLK